MKKNIFKDNKGNIHFGINAPNGFFEGNRKDIANAVKNMGSKKIWRCNVCNDLHIGLKSPEECPTCHVVNAYCEIELNEFNKLVDIL